MNTHEPIDAFNRDLTRIINGQRPDEAADRDYEGLIELAQTMAGTDLSAASQIRFPLRRRLLTEIAPQLQGAASMRKPFWRRRRLAATLAALAIVAALTVTVPPLRTFAQQILHRIGLITITNEPSSAQEFLAVPEPSVPPADEPTAAPPPSQPEPGEYVPRAIPAGYGLQYRAGHPSYVLAGSGDPQHEAYFRIYTRSAANELAVGDALVIPLTVRGTSGAFIKDAPLYVRVPEGVERARKDQLEVDPVNLLIWDEGGATVIVESNALGQAELQAIAESLTR